MKKSEETLEDFAISYPLDKLAPLEQILFLDIETTGFTSRTSYLYMIGCAYYQAGKWRTIQWMADDYSQEGDILTAFFDFARDYRYLVHFNGNNFDLPFITQKCAQLKLPFSFDGFQGIDIYRRISPYKFFLKLPNCKQKTLEQYLGIARTDVFSGGELIGLYHDYVKNPSEFTEKALFLHNADDLKGMLEVLPILAYYDLFNENCVKARKVQANYYKDVSGAQRKELLITGIISAGFVEQYQRKSSLSNIKAADIHEIAEIFVDKRFAGKSVEEMEEAEQVTIFLILREDLSILPQKDTILKLNDIIVIRGENP